MDGKDSKAGNLNLETSKETFYEREERERESGEKHCCEIQELGVLPIFSVIAVSPRGKQQQLPTADFLQADSRQKRLINPLIAKKI
mgnify:CR=1 FL=1